MTAMLWFAENRIPRGVWPFLNTTRHSLIGIEEALLDEVDLTEGGPDVLITGCMQAYRQAIFRRVLDLAQSIVASWNAGLPIGAMVAGRSLLETIATFHSFLTRAEEAAARRDWHAIGRLVDAYAFSSSSGRDRSSSKQKSPEHPPRIGKIVSAFAKATQPGSEVFWDQICDTAHPNGKRMMEFAGTLRDRRYISRPAADSEPNAFIAVYNALYSCCWLSNSDVEVNILLERIRRGEALPPDHPLILQQEALDRVTAQVMSTLGPITPSPGPVALMAKEAELIRQDPRDTQPETLTQITSREQDDG